MKVFVFINLLGNNNSSIGGGNYRIVLLTREMSPWRTEEVEYQNEKQYRCNEENNIEQVYRTKTIEQPIYDE